MVIKILGSGCANCKRLEGLVSKASDELGLGAEVVKLTDFADIMAYGVLSTPALVIDEQLILSGRVPPYDEVKAILQRSGQ